MMTTMITCPSCGNDFEPTDAIRNEMNKKAKEWQVKKEEEFRQKELMLQKQLLSKEDEVIKRIAEEKKKMQSDLEQSIRKSLSADFENQLKILQQSVSNNEEKLKEARKKEFDFLQKAQEFKRKEEEFELNIQKKVSEERERLSIEIRKIEDQKLQQLEHDFKLRLAEKEKQLEDQKKLAEEMKRKAEQGSMQLQGEVQELLLENILHSTFPHDKIVPVGKGVRGADCIQTICNPFGQ